MWYVIWTSTGSENKTLDLIRSKVQRCICPTKKTPKKIKGEWLFVDKPLFPGYVFADTDRIEELALFLRQTEGFNTILTSNKIYCPLLDNESRMIEQLYLTGGVFDMSQGYIEGDRIFVEHGPLKGMEGFIKKIDRHKKSAIIQIDLFEQEITAQVGLEIINKN